MPEGWHIRGPGAHEDPSTDGLDPTAERPGSAERPLPGRAGVPAPKARELAVTLPAALESAFALGRAVRSTQPLEIAGAALFASVRGALERRRQE
ncbi:hypothetical protein ACQPYK_27115 [Streptosporangium sp. CA-135522]|uniref:hypothetical protein n=1 Tax=Streptosporangium sp. CA-135522 TaxID=3240072 RepID=UPI003D8FEFF6